MRPTGLLLLAGLALAAAGAPASASASKLSGVKRIVLHTSDGDTVAIGTATFTPQGDRTAFRIDVDTSRLKDFFLSMREFKCLEGKEIHCHVPYPYANPQVVAGDDFSWLETSLIFMFKRSSEFGATLANGLYYPLRRTARGLSGTPHLVDLNQIAAPPGDASRPPFPASDRLDVEEGSRWITRLVIE